MENFTTSLAPSLSTVVRCYWLTPLSDHMFVAAAAAAAAAAADAYIGLALLFDVWRHADGWLGLPRWPRVDPGALPDPQQLQEAGDAVRAQADAVRALKQGQGLSNKVGRGEGLVAKTAGSSCRLVLLRQSQRRAYKGCDSTASVTCVFWCRIFCSRQSTCKLHVWS
jgi:hypothetical protein